MMSLFTLMNLFLVVFENLMTAYLTSSFFEQKYSKRYYWLFVSALIIIQNTMLFFLGEHQILKPLLTVLLVILWAKALFKATLIKCIFEAVLLLSYWTIADHLFLMGSVFFAHSDMKIVIDRPYVFYTLCYSAKIVELFGIALLCFWIKNHLRTQAASRTDWLRTLFFPISALIISVFLSRILFIEPESASELLICTMLLLITDVMSILMLDHIEKQQRAIQDNVILRQNLKKERDGISAWMEAYKEERKCSHDFQNQLAVLRGMADSDCPREDFLQYLDGLLNIKLPLTLYIDTHRSVADVLLSQKMAIAKNKDIKFVVQLDDLSQFMLPDDALVVVLSNLLDNAIEACEKIEEPAARYILLKMQIKPEGSYLYIENSTKDIVSIKNNRIITSKVNKMEHGYGLQNITTMLERYNTIYAIDFRSDTRSFCFSALISE